MKLVENIRGLRARTWVIAAAVAVVVVGGGTTWAVLASGAGTARAASEAPAAQSVAASLETLEKTIEATGTLAPTVQEDVAFAVSGTVTGVNVVAGQTVAAGDVLATVDTLTVNAELLSARASLASAEATLASAEADDDGTDEGAARIEAYEAAVTVAQHDVSDAEAAVGEATLVAPVAGLVTSVGVAVGDAVTGASSSGSSGTGSAATGSSGTASAGASGTTGSSGTTSTSSAQFTIVSTDSWQVSLSVGETDIANVAAGYQVEFSTDDGAGFFGTVGTVGLLPSTTSGAAAYPVTVDVTGSPENLHDGLSVTASIVYERRTEVLTVPSAAVTTDADGTSTVTVVSADAASSAEGAVTAVTVGETVGALTEITEGLAVGDLVQVTVFVGGSGGSGGTTGDTRGAGTGTGTGGFPAGGELPEGFDPSQMGGGMPGQGGAN